VFIVLRIYIPHIGRNTGGGLNKEGTFIELCKSLIDSLNARHCGLDDTFAKSTFSMSFYDSMVIFEKIQWLNDSFKEIITPKGND